MIQFERCQNKQQNLSESTGCFMKNFSQKMKLPQLQRISIDHHQNSDQNSSESNSSAHLDRNKRKPTSRWLVHNNPNRGNKMICN